MRGHRAQGAPLAPTEESPILLRPHYKDVSVKFHSGVVYEGRSGEAEGSVILKVPFEIRVAGFGTIWQEIAVFFRVLYLIYCIKSG
jgi:hypothetical protein